MNINKLKNILKIRKVTQKELAEGIGLTQAGVSYIFNETDMKVSTPLLGTSEIRLF